MESKDKMERKRKELLEDNFICYTMDTDWASEYIIKNTVNYFIKMGIPVTVFCTNHSDYLNSIKNSALVDLQIHPNFIQPSSQGGNDDDVIRYCMDIVPDAKVFRAHRWYASNDIYDKLYDRGIQVDSNLCTMMDDVQPFRHRSGMISFPVFLEDGAILYHNMSTNFKDTKKNYDRKGLKIINLHPMHFMVNTPYFKYTREIKDKLSREEWNSIGETELGKLKNDSQGISDYIKNLAEYSKDKLNVVSFKELYTGML